MSVTPGRTLPLSTSKSTTWRAWPRRAKLSSMICGGLRPWAHPAVRMRRLEVSSWPFVFVGN
eukprot:2238910-Pyramimonas_sp.AAC.1